MRRARVALNGRWLGEPVTREHPNFAGTRYLDSYSGQRLEFVLQKAPEPRMVKPFEHHPV